MKKITATVLSVMLIVSIFAGCSNNGGGYKPVSTTLATTELGKYDGDIKAKWDDVQSDYDKLAEEGKKEAESADINDKYVLKTLADIRNNAIKLRDGMTDEDTEAAAKQLYKDAFIIDTVIEKNNKLINEDIGTLSNDIKQLVKQYYGVAERDYETVYMLVCAKTYAGQSWLNNVWNDNKQAFAEADKIAKEDVRTVDGITMEEFATTINAVKTMLDKYDYAYATGADVYNVAKDMYRFGVQVQKLGNRSETELGSQLIALGDNLIALSYHYVGKSTTDFDETRMNITLAIKAINSIPEDVIRNSLTTLKK